MEANKTILQMKYARMIWLNGPALRMLPKPCRGKRLMIPGRKELNRYLKLFWKINRLF